MKSNNLHSLLDAHAPLQPSLTLASVCGQANEWFFLQGIPGCAKARRAPSCLVMPELGDTVLVCDTGSELSAYVLAVVIKATAGSGTLTLPGEATLQACEGNVQISAKTVDLQASVQLQLGAPLLNVNAAKTELRIRKMMGWFESVESQAIKINVVAKTMTSQVGRLLQRAKDSFRWIQNNDETRAGRVRTKVSGHYLLQSENTSIQSEGLVRINGEKIDLG